MDDRTVQENLDPTIGVVGIGRMGAVILQHLGAHFALVAHDVDESRRSVAVAAGAAWDQDATGLAGRVEVLVTVLPGPTELQAAMSMILPALTPGALWIDMTTGNPEVTGELARVAHQHRVEMVTAVIGGSLDDAAAGALTFYTSGTAAAVARALPVLRLISGDAGTRLAGDRAEDGQIVKLLANALWFANATAAAEALLLGQALGLRPERLQPLLRDSAGGSTFMRQHVERLLVGDYLETFGIDRIVEELDTVAALAASTGTATAMLDVSGAVHREALHRYGPVLGELLGLRLLEERAGTRLRSDMSRVD